MTEAQKKAYLDQQLDEYRNKYNMGPPTSMAPHIRIPDGPSLYDRGGKKKLENIDLENIKNINLENIKSVNLGKLDLKN